MSLAESVLAREGRAFGSVPRTPFWQEAWMKSTTGSTPMLLIAAEVWPTAADTRCAFKAVAASESRSAMIDWFAADNPR